MPESRTVAVIGASSDRRKFGNKALRAYVACGWRVFPVNPKETEVEGLTAYPSVTALPVAPEVVSLYVPPRVVSSLLPEIAAREPQEIWFNPGTIDEALAEELSELDLPIVSAYSIVALGHSPSEFPDR